MSDTMTYPCGTTATGPGVPEHDCPEHGKLCFDNADARPPMTPEEVYAAAVGELIEAKRALFKEELRRPEFKLAALANLKERGYTKTESTDLATMDPDYAKYKESVSELELAVLRAEALVQVRKVQMWRTVASLTMEGA